jgi:hypothetical protein
MDSKWLQNGLKIISKKTAIWGISAFASAVLISACGQLTEGLKKDTAAGSAQASGSSAETNQTVSFSAQISPALKSNCNNCHGEGEQPPALTTYQEVVAAGPNNILGAVTNGGNMEGNAPMGFSSNLSAWISAGALNN